MTTLYVLFGVVIGILISILVTILFFSKTKDNLERVVKKLVARKASIINPNNPLDEVEI